MPQAVSNVDRNRLIDCYERDEDYVRLAASLGVNRRTANGIITTFVCKGRRHQLLRGGSWRQIFTKQMRQVLIDFVEEKPTATMIAMKAKLLHLFPHSPVSITTAGRLLYHTEAVAHNTDVVEYCRNQAGSTRFRHFDDGHQNSPKPPLHGQMQLQFFYRKDSGAISQRLTSCSHSL